MGKSSLQNIYFIDVYDSEVNENINTETLYNETISNFKYINKNINHEFILINSKQEFIDTLKKIEIEIIENSFTLIHLSIHGSSELDGVISSNGELITWLYCEKGYEGHTKNEYGYENENKTVLICDNWELEKDFLLCLGDLMFNI